MSESYFGDVTCDFIKTDSKLDIFQRLLLEQQIHKTALNNCL